MTIDAATQTHTGSTAAAPTPPDFPVAWADPADADRMWVWGADHFPVPFSPLSLDYAQVSWDRTQAQPQRGVRPHERGVFMFVNGYFYSLRKPKPDPNAPPPEPDPVVEERKRRHDEMAARLVPIWRGEIEPEIRRLCRGVRDRDYDSLTAAEIADLLPSCFADAADAFALTHVATDGMFAALRPLVAFLKDAFPTDNADQLAGELCGGFTSYTSSSETAIWRLARLAEQTPSVRDALLSHETLEVDTALRLLPEAAPFRRAIAEYLDLYGWRPELWWELTFPVWAEDPTALYDLIRYYLRTPTADPRRAQRRAAARRRATVRRTRERLKTDPEKLARFDALLPTAQQYVPVREDRALWQLTATGIVRVPCLALGRKLADARLLDAPEDVFFLHLEELQRLAHTGQVGLTEALDHHALIAERRADRQRRLATTPPPVIGRMDPTWRDDVGAQTGRFAAFGFEDDVAEDGRTPILKGGAASRGVVRARARVVRTLAEGDKLAPGEILVCRATSPAWTPLVARAGGVVADTGGILAHCAIVAREHAIPCVVGTGTATTRIQDGMLITVDGTQGTVRLDGDVPADERGGPGAQPPRQGAWRAERAQRARPPKNPARGSRGSAASPWQNRQTEPLIVWLGDPPCHNTLLTGGKAANLSRLASAHRVPPGFCLTAAAYDAVYPTGEPTTASAPIPTTLRDALLAAYAQLAARCGTPHPAVAVRSSAIDEDGAAASFAGQHETILNVSGGDALLAAIQRCWRSLHAAGALAYRADRGLSTDGVRLAVLVQQLVPADASGVLFTANPVTGDREEALLTTNYGLGESIVGGLVTPDTYVIRKAGPTGPQIISLDLGDKEMMTVPSDGATREVSVPHELRSRPSVSDAQAVEAVQLGIQLEREMGFPVDVELAWKDGVLYLLQCRPITTLSAG